MEFESIPGVGEKTADALSALDGAERALREGDVARIASAPGISTGRAARIARAAIRHRHGESGEFPLTDRAREIHREAVGLLAERAVTGYAEKRIRTFYPSAAPSRIEEVRELAERAIEREPAPAVLEALEGVEPIEAPSDVAVRDRCLATADAERYAEAREAVPEMSVELVEDAAGLAELARGYSTVVALDGSFAGLDVDGDVRVEPDALDRPAELVPERILSFFAANRGRIRAAIDVHRAAGLEAPLDLDRLADRLDRLGADGSVAGDGELDRLVDAVDGLDDALDEAERIGNERLRAAIRERDVTIEGTDLLSLVERGAGVDSLLERELAEEHGAAVAAAREHVVDRLDLEDGEAALAAEAFPDDPSYPIERREGAAGRLREELTGARDRRSARLKRELADDLGGARGAVEELVRAALELDVELSIARFARDFGCTMPEFGGDGIAIRGGRSPLLDVAPDAVEPVDYDADGVRLLSGVNSGGKTSLLDLLALVAVLAHMGLPVPADGARLQRFDGIYYHAKTQGTLDAGAFEATLRGFADLAADDGDDLVLVDELESITEPGASAVIVAGVLEALRERSATAVFVSHLAEEVRDAADGDLPVDGIEALGLEGGELRVNRSPVPDHLARSTPELIVEKLADGDGAAFYGRLLSKFDDR